MTDFIRGVIEASGEVLPERPEFEKSNILMFEAAAIPERFDSLFGYAVMKSGFSGFKDNYEEHPPKIKCRTYLCQEQRECGCNR